MENPPGFQDCTAFAQTERGQRFHMFPLASHSNGEPFLNSWSSESLVYYATAAGAGDGKARGVRSVRGSVMIPVVPLLGMGPLRLAGFEALAI